MNTRPLTYLLSLLTLTAVLIAGAGCSDDRAEPGAEADSTAVVADSSGTAADSLESLEAAASDTLTADTQQAADSTGSAGEESTAAPGSRVRDALPAADEFQNFGFRFFWALVVLALAWLMIRGTAFVLDALSERSAERRLFYKRLVPIARILLWSIALYVIIRGVFQVDARSLVAAAAAIGVAVGFAAQDLLKNIFGGLVIISDRPFQVGDKISVGGTYGEVTSIGLRSTRIVTPDDNMVTVPNAQVVDGQVANANAGALDCQVVTDLYLPGFVDEQIARRIAYEAAASSKFVYRNKPIVVLVKDEFKETFLTHIKVKAYVFDTRHEFRLMSDITERARRGFRDAGLFDAAAGARAWVQLAPGMHPDAPSAPERPTA